MTSTDEGNKRIGHSDEVAFSVDAATKTITPLAESNLASFDIWERRDLQRWIIEHPEIIEPDLLVVTTEFDRWQQRERRVPDRLDVLFLDSDGSPLVAELKRGEAPDTTELQALKYAAYCSQLTVEEIIEEHAESSGLSSQDARAAVLEHAPSLAKSELGQIRIRLVAETFGPSVSHVVMWLREYGLDIGAVQVTTRRGTDGNAVVSARRLLPPPAAEDYLVKRRQRDAEEHSREATARRRNSVTILLEADALPSGQPLTLRTDYFSDRMRARVEEAIRSDPTIAEAEWTGISVREALRWKHDGQTYSASRLVGTLLANLGFPNTSIDGPEYWLIDGETTLFAKSVEIEPERSTG